jgi:CheY-like chemotaxis protein
VGIKILLADDSVTAQNMGKKILSEAGHEVVTVSNGAAAAKKIAEIKPELVLLDVFMPGYSGLELCEKLRGAAETSKIPVLLTVGRMEPYNAQDGARVKADGVIVKPFEATDLTAAVDRIAEKVKPAKASAESARGMKIIDKQPDPAIASAVVENVEKAGTSEPAQPEEKPYEKTIRLNAAHVQAMLEQGPGMSEAASAIESSIQGSSNATLPKAPDFKVGPSHAEEFETFQDAGNFKSEPEAKPAEASIPSFMAQYLPETQEEKVPAAPAVTVEAPMHEQPTGAFPIHNEFLSTRSQNEIHGERRRREDPGVSSVPELELTAAAPVPDMPVPHEPGLELTRQSVNSSAEILADPALETDPHRSTMDFPTHFGTSEAELANKFLESLQHPTDNSAAPPDEFEARLNAAMESYETTSLELPSASASPNADLLKTASHFETNQGLAADSFEAQVNAAMQTFDSASPVGHQEAAPEIVTEPTLEVDTEPAAENHFSSQTAPVIEMPVRHFEPHDIDITPSVSASEAPEPETAEIKILAPETDESVIQQMREGLSHHPVEAPHVEIPEPAPMAMAAAASAVTPSAPPSLAQDAEAEIGRAMAAAIGREGSSNQPEQPTTPAESAAPGRDANHLAGAVESVMKRELPNLIWKIMAELDLRKRG